jgi:hypothetical protein
VKKVKGENKMKTKTVRLGSDYFLENGVVCLFGYSHDDESHNAVYSTYETKYKIGNHAMLVSRENLKTEEKKFFLKFDDDGISGNSDHTIKRYHGWRGTTDDISITAHGLRKITKIKKLKNGQIAITVGSDLTPDEK